jgi:hypothetical protein
MSIEANGLTSRSRLRDLFSRVSCVSGDQVEFLRDRQEAFSFSPRLLPGSMAACAAASASVSGRSRTSSRTGSTSARWCTGARFQSESMSRSST